MKLGKIFSLAFKSILSSKLRSFLTMLGIIIGVGAVIVIVGLGNGMKNYMTSSFQGMGANVLTVTIVGRNSTRSVSVDDMYAIADDNPQLFSAMSPTVSVSASATVGTTQLTDTIIAGVSEDYQSIKQYAMYDGRFITYADSLTRNKICVVGSYINNTFYSGAAVGQTIKLNGDVYTIVGVVSQVADSTEGSSDDMILLPYASAEQLMNTARITGYSYAMVSEDQVTEAISTVEGVLYNVFQDTNAYRVTSMSEVLNTMTSMINIVVMVLSIIAGISLLVGGIGIMNIMLVSVSERTREIGIRKALGAKRRNILFQFVIEAGTTSAIGGLFGIAVGYLLSMVGTVVISSLMSENIKVAPSIWSVVMAFCVSAGIGILFGFLPARKAARLNPIDALRYE